MASSPPAIEIRGLTKRYGAITAVNDVDLTIEAGQIYALLGPNGAGKTTLVEILEGYRERDAGEVSVLGYDPQGQRGELNRRVGIVLQRSTPMEGLTPSGDTQILGQALRPSDGSRRGFGVGRTQRTCRPARLETLRRAEAAARSRYQRDRESRPDLPRRSRLPVSTCLLGVRPGRSCAA